MIAIKERQRLDKVPEPFEYFDLICGSGFGGILALMLGRLRMVCKPVHLS
jgi:patatin-like phospholipase/acyl hydrolase